MSIRPTSVSALAVVGALLTLFVLVAVGCAQPDPPVAPSNEQAALSSGTSVGTEVTSPRLCWGIWDVLYEPGGTIELIPLREAQYRVNVNQFLQPPLGSLANLKVNIIDESQFFSRGRLVVDVILTHPFPDYSEYAGFDILGVFIHHGSYTARHDGNIRYAQPGTNAVLSNADNYTRWMNRPEFTASGLGGYTEGALGTSGVFWGATANPYKYFCDGLGSTETITQHYSAATMVSSRGVFRAGRTNTRRYDLTFPKTGTLPDTRFQYAVVASWVEPNNVPPSSVPGDFPAAANMFEPFHMTADTDGSTVYYNSVSDRGGDLLLTLEIFDHGARTDPNKVAGQISEIVVESPNNLIPGSHMLTFTPSNWTTSPGSTQISQKFILDCGAVTPQGPNPRDNPIFVAVRAASGSFNTGLGTPYPSGAVRAFQTFSIPMTGWSPDAPGNVTGFQASDALASLGHHEVELTWDAEPNADEYTIQRRDYNTSSELWEWGTIYTAGFGETSYVDSGARYCGTANPIEYRIRASNAYGNSPAWSTDTGYPKRRPIEMAFWCAANDASGSGAVLPWATAVADYNDCNDFWNDYGYEFVMLNSGNYFWVDTIAYRHLSNEFEAEAMHDQYGKQSGYLDAINVYYVESSHGSYSIAYCMAYCPGSYHNAVNSFVVMTLNSRNCQPPNQQHIVLAHEFGHAAFRFWDIYLMDINSNGRLDPGENCSLNTFCPVERMYCDEDAAYPEEPGGYSKTPKNLMWYSYCGRPISDYDVTVGQYIESSRWLRTHEGGYPVP